MLSRGRWIKRRFSIKQPNSLGHDFCWTKIIDSTAEAYPGSSNKHVPHDLLYRDRAVNLINPCCMACMPLDS